MCSIVKKQVAQKWGKVSWYFCTIGGKWKMQGWLFNTLTELFQTFIKTLAIKARKGCAFCQADPLDTNNLPICHNHPPLSPHKPICPNPVPVGILVQICPKWPPGGTSWPTCPRRLPGVLRDISANSATSRLSLANLPHSGIRGHSHAYPPKLATRGHSRANLLHSATNWPPGGNSETISSKFPTRGTPGPICPIQPPGVLPGLSSHIGLQEALWCQSARIIGIDAGLNDNLGPLATDLRTKEDNWLTTGWQQLEQRPLLESMIRMRWIEFEQ